MRGFSGVARKFCREQVEIGVFVEDENVDVVVGQLDGVFVTLVEFDGFADVGELFVNELAEGEQKIKNVFRIAENAVLNTFFAVL